MSKNIIGFVLIDAPHSALNNAGQDASSRTDNKVVTKFIRRGRDVFPYVSGQAWRYWWRNILAKKYSWQMSPILRGQKNTAFTSANPFQFPDDDVFGYMRAVKKDKGGTLTRLSPLKCSPLVSVKAQLPTDDFGVMSRHEGDPVLYEHQFYSTVMKGIFSLDINNVGIFYDIARTGFKNLDDKYVDTKEIKSAIQSFGATKENGAWKLPKAERVKRVSETIAALPYIYTTTKSATHLTDVSPKFIILAIIDGGNHIFMNIAGNDQDGSLINISAFEQVINDYKDIIISDIYIGLQVGFMDDISERLNSIKWDGKEIKILSPKKAVDQFVDNIDKYIE